MLSLWMNVTDEVFTPWMESTINESTPPTFNVKLTSAETKIWGIRLGDIRVIDMNQRVELVRIDEFDISLNLISALFSLGFPYKMSLYQGSIDGVVRFIPGLNTSVSGEDIQLEKVNPIRKSNLVTSKPKLSFDGKLYFTEPITGELDVEISNMKIVGDSKTTNLPLELPETRLSKVNGNLNLSERSMELKATSQGDIQANLQGTINVNWKTLDQSRVNLSLTAVLEKDYSSKLGFVSQIIDGYKNSSGAISLKLTGNLSSPNVSKL